MVRLEPTAEVADPISRTPSRSFGEREQNAGIPGLHGLVGYVGGVAQASGVCHQRCSQTGRAWGRHGEDASLVDHPELPGAFSAKEAPRLGVEPDSSPPPALCPLETGISSSRALIHSSSPHHQTCRSSPAPPAFRFGTARPKSPRRHLLSHAKSIDQRPCILKVRTHACFPIIDIFHT